MKHIINLIEKSKRPIILLGNGVRLGNSEKEFFKLAKILNIPIVTSKNATDLIWESHPLYVGRVGSFGQRHANFAIQNCDLLLSIGSRIGLAVTGWAHKNFARGAKKIVVDIDKAELEKPTIQPDIAVNMDVREFIPKMLLNIKGHKDNNYKEWKKKIKHWKKKYPNVLPEWRESKEINIYNFTEILSDELNSNDTVVLGVGMSLQCIMHAFKLKKNQKLFASAGFCAMGWGLPGAIGACVANKKRRIICIVGDGGFMMNIQELQTLKHYNLPIKIFIVNNKGYTSIRETQRTYFEGLLGSDKESGVSMPDFIKVAKSYGIKSKKISNQKNLRKEIKEVLDYKGPILCDLDIPENQPVQPKQGAFSMPNGKKIPRPIEDMFPYLDREELKEEMIIEPITQI